MLGELESGSAGPSSASPGSISSSRSVAYLAYSLEISVPSHLRPSFLATANVVPLPAKGSKTVSPLDVVTIGGRVVANHEWYRDYYLAREADRGLDAVDDALCAANVYAELRQGET